MECGPVGGREFASQHMASVQFQIGGVRDSSGYPLALSGGVESTMSASDDEPAQAADFAPRTTSKLSPRAQAQLSGA